MKKLTPPNDDAIVVFEVCIARVRDADLKRRLQSCSEEIGEAAEEFNQKAALAELHTIEAKDNVANAVSVDEMKKVYTGRMAKKLAPGRIYYDRIMALPEHGRCPLCSQRVVSTLDHHLPKAHFPSLAVSPLNLIPSCQDCNKTKSEEIPRNSEQETLHPYYDDVESFSWVKAKLEESIPVVVEFYVDPPQNCDGVLMERLKHHFRTFKLSALYSSHAAEELASIEYIARKIFEDGGSNELKGFLKDAAESRKQINVNSWQTALYTCLYESEWFCQNRFM
ncbi:HNH endonuclease signature motif containing protein [Shewanella mangrovisoli]|uniref:HNH endonuclease signature motif containing protein n=1 Tax=Shewanella mangrovisoli TaxID=2864211 RepID=A0ABV4VEA5_9GAMM